MCGERGKSQEEDSKEGEQRGKTWIVESRENAQNEHADILANFCVFAKRESQRFLKPPCFPQAKRLH